MHDPIDIAFTAFEKLSAEISTYTETIASESDTRLKVIDRILTEVLGWSHGAIQTSEQAGSGYTDYVLRIGNSSRLVIEAKKDGATFNLQSRNSGQAYKLNGAVFHGDALAAIEQAVRYNAYKNAELACATNGQEWIVFRANRLGDGQDTMDGKAFVFASLSEIAKNFPLFYDLLAYQPISNLKYRGFFQEAEGLPMRDLSFMRSLRPPDSRHLLPPGEFATDFNAIMGSFFHRLKGDEDAAMIIKCFVVTPESNLADKKLSRIAGDVVVNLKGLNPGTGEQLVDLLKNAQQQHRNRFVLLIGNKGAGKSTFLDRFFKTVLPKEISDGLVTIRLDLGLSEGDAKKIVPWLNDHLLAAAEEAVFQDNSRTWDDFVGAVFFDEYQRWSKVTMRHLYETDKNQFKIEFGRHIEEIRKSRPHDFIKRLLHDIVCSRKKVPCVILDNTDHFTIEFQEAVFQYSRSIYESNYCIFIIPITDKTSWQLSKQGALQSFESEALYLPVPSAERVIERRITYLLEKLKEGDDKQRHEYFFGRGIRLDIPNIHAFADSLNRIFVETPKISDWLGGLSNYDIRRMLELTRDVISSPHLPIEELLKAHIAGTAMAVQEWKIRNAIIKRKYDIFPADENPFVQNIYALSLDVPTSPLLGIRILQFLRDSQESGNDDHTFVPISYIYDHMNALGFHFRVVTPWLESLLKTGLVLDYDPTITDISDASRLEISPAGKVHLFWGSVERDYVGAMKEVTPIRDKATFEQLLQFYRAGYSGNWNDSMIVFVDYLLDEDAQWCEVPDHRQFAGQKGVCRRLSIMRDRLSRPQQKQAVSDKSHRYRADYAGN